MPYKTNKPDNSDNQDESIQNKFFENKKIKEKIKEYEKNEPLFDDDYIEKQLQEELLKERESNDEESPTTKFGRIL
ncbi:hypothetical protein [Legionella longbeachae]|uniref:Uncharacterized protein n=1 Tax=Legionella longbeachae serogroup 1 (strain NSW150) TaxID=661367 RepID=D3HPZ6_LEGLN|nr:hypothetical protein [Legionella longbeachae]VEE01480.1 Uncharacterised protein [Legionella oakridgensis]HBD7396198.1 hypothetical protein [Legionella pneumophila]ARB92162.1 hypothetical protein A6J40_08215 [Legionella longbeachae]ARM34658.1 hypothetical protein B0B39_14510 [Legionella longbeachae]EEZ96038.1 hypothetical protein LLB_1221 [Legionella longbeachae D-4968]